MAPLLSTLSTIPRRSPPTPTTSNFSPKAALLLSRGQNLLPRATLTNPGAGVTDPHDINNNAVFALFGLIGVAFIVTGIWFFFWAKNGGFYFKESDWDEYKSTVLRRKGPNGTTLSGATASTDLGGGSVVHGEKGRSLWGRKKGKKEKRYKDFDEESEMTGSAGGSTLGSAMSELKWKAAAAEKKPKKAKKESKLRGGELVPGEDEEVDAGVRDVLRTYRHEKPARVGGLNKAADGSAWDGSTDNSTAASELLNHREHTPTNTPTKPKKERGDNLTGGTGGIRKVVSTSNGTSFWSRATESDKKKEQEDRVKAEARKLQEKGRAAQRRDFSFQVGDDNSSVTASQSASQLNGEERQARREESREERQARRERREAREARRASRSPTKKVPGSYYEESVGGREVSTDVGTKSYHHPIPGLSSTAGSEYAEERRKKRGYRRDDN